MSGMEINSTLGVGVTSYIYHGYTGGASDTHTRFGFPFNDTIDFDTDGTQRLRINNSSSTFSNNIIANGNIDLAGDIDVDGHTNLDNVSVAGVTTFTDDVYFDGATAGRDITFDRSENKLHFNHNARAEFGQGSYNTQFKSDGTNFTLVHNPITAFYLYSNTFNVIGAGNRSGNTYDNTVISAHNGVVKLGFELPNGGANTLDNLVT
ncbi:MAG: hypothetical protein VXY93_13895, partial [Pseudomonadota bacterium]|nr:hypothetical protein [Pseudomonadota bacterium]